MCNVIICVWGTFIVCETVTDRKMWEELRKKLNWNFLWKLLVLLIGTLILLLIIIFIIKFHQNPNKSYCVEPPCIIAAANLLKSLDTSKNPCDDFHGFICKFPESTNRSAAARVKFEEIFTSNHSDSLPEENLKYIYKLCMNLTEIENEGLDFVKQMLDEVGGWPASKENWDDSTFDWVAMILKLRSKGLDFRMFFDFEVKNVDNKIYLKIGPPKLKKLSVEKSLEEINYMTNVAKLLGGKFKKFYQRITEAYNLKKSLIDLVEKEKYKDHNVFVTYKDLQNKSDILDLKYFTERILLPFHLRDDERVIFAIQPYLEGLQQIFRNTSGRTLANYILWSAMQDLIDWFPKDLRQNDFDNSSIKTRSEVCIEQSKIIFPMIADSIYASRLAPEPVKEGVIEIVRNVKNEFADIVQNINWMDTKTKNATLNQLRAMKIVVNDGEILPQLFYAYKKLQGNNYLDVVLKAKKEYENFQFSLLNKTVEFVNKLNFIDFNDDFQFSKNILIIPPTVIQNLYDKNNPDYINYAKITYEIGRQMFRPFTRQNSLWSELTHRKYREIKNCLKELHKNNSQNQYQINETLADMIGTYLTYKAFVDNLKPKNNLVLPGFGNYSVNQLFWMANAKFSCDKNPTKSRFRSLTSLGHLGYFAHDFNCPASTTMNPVEKCQIFSL